MTCELQRFFGKRQEPSRHRPERRAGAVAVLNGSGGSKLALSSKATRRSTPHRPGTLASSRPSENPRDDNVADCSRPAESSRSPISPADCYLIKVRARLAEPSPSPSVRFARMPGVPHPPDGLSNGKKRPDADCSRPEVSSDASPTASAPPRILAWLHPASSGHDVLGFA